MINVASLLETFSKARILCVGDVMLDRFIHGSISRISPEAPVPVLAIKEEIAALGGAGNVARNIESLGGKVTFLSVIGKDDWGKKIQNLLEKNDRINAHLIEDNTRITTTKSRFIAGSQQIMRADREQIQPLSAKSETNLLEKFKKELPHHDVVILSDYAKGVLSRKVVQTCIQEARACGKRVLVDPKGLSFSLYKGATLLTPNRHELVQALNRPLNAEEDLVQAAQELTKANDFSGVIVTRGAEGMTLVEASGLVENLPTQAQEVFDVSGAGDTVVAVLALCLCAGASFSESMFLANIAAGLVVSKVGTAAVHPEELIHALHAHDFEAHDQKIQPLEKAVEKLQKWRKMGSRIVFTNGCFDLLHPGHISLLNQAKRAGDRLVLGLNTDASIRRLKGPERPIQTEQSRAYVLSSLECVDLVILFDEDTPLRLIETLKPDVLVKGADYTVDQVVGAPFVQSYGGKILLVDLVEGHSTTKIAEKMRA